jgi:hypothetical protein
MNRRFFRLVGVVAVLVGLVAGVASAQGAKKVAFETSFGFVVNDKVMPAGRYEIEALSGQGPTSLVIRSLGSNDKVMVKTITRLADLGGKEPKIVFDKTADTQYLAEVHIPGMDGFDVQHAPGEHGHTKVTAKE